MTFLSANDTVSSLTKRENRGIVIAGGIGLMVVCAIAIYLMNRKEQAKKTR